MRALVKQYRYYTIYFEDEREVTMPNPHWEVVNGCQTIILDGRLSLDDVEKILDGVM